MPLMCLAIDQSINSCGFAVLHGLQIIETHLETYQGIKQDDKQGRYLKYGNVIQRLVKEHNPNFVILEMVRGYHAPVIEVLSSLIAVTMVAIPRHTPLYTVNTSTWKKQQLGDGHGNAEKQLSIDRIEALYGTVFPEDVCEAILIGRFGVERYNWLLKLTKSQRGLAKKII